METNNKKLNTQDEQKKPDRTEIDLKLIEKINILLQHTKLKTGEAVLFAVLPAIKLMKKDEDEGLKMINKIISILNDSVDESKKLIDNLLEKNGYDKNKYHLIIETKNDELIAYIERR